MKTINFVGKAMPRRSIIVDGVNVTTTIDGEVTGENEFINELVAQAYLRFLMLLYRSLGYKRIQ